MPKFNKFFTTYDPKNPKNPGTESIPTISAGEKSKALNLVSLEIDHPNLKKPSQVSSDLEILEDLHSIESWLVHQGSNHINNGLVQSQYNPI